MKIGGFQKFSLLDYPGELAAIIFTQGCNFRCSYCHNPELVDAAKSDSLYPEDQILDFLKRRIGKLNAVVIGGGEPTLQEDLEDFLAKIKAMNYLIKVDTNGSLPEVIECLVKKKLVDYWAMDLKAPESLYPVVTRSDIPFSSILKSMEIIRSSSKSYEFRTTFFDRLLHLEDLEKIRSLLQPGDKFYIQQCQYSKTLDNLSNPATRDNTAYINMQNHPVFQSLIEWGTKNQVKIEIRTL